MLKSKIIIIFLICLLLSPPASFAHHGGEGINGAGLAGPIVTIPAYTLPKKRYSIGLQTNYQNYDSFSSRELKQLARRNEEIDNPGHFLAPTLGIAYGITDDLSIFASLPYNFRYSVETVHDGEVNKEGNSIGIGDLTLFTQYRFLKREDIDLHVALLAGLKIPTGVRRDKNDVGGRFDIDNQPGTGSWDPQVGLAASKKIGHLAIDSNILYIFSTQGVQDSIRGDIATYNLAFSYGLNHHSHFTNKMFFDHFLKKKLTWDAILELNGQWSEKPKIGSEREENDGGTIIYLSPGVRLTIDHKWIANLSVGLPIIENVNGRGRPPSARIIFGIVRAF